MTPNIRRSVTGLILKGFDFLNKLLGVDVRFFAKNATIVTVSYAVSIVRGVITGYLVARLFPRELYGQYQFILSMVGTVGVMSLPGVIVSLSRAVARGEKGVTLPVARIQCDIAIVASCVLVGIIPFLPPDRQGLWPLFLLAAILFPVSQTASSIFSAVTVGKSRFDIGLKANIAWSAGTALCVSLILYIHPSSALLYVTMTALPALSYLWFGRKVLEDGKRTAEIGPIVRYGIQLTLASLPVSLSWYVDKLLISAIFGLNQLAVFSIGILLPEQVKTFAKELLPVSFAAQAQGEDSNKRRRRLISAVGRATLIFSLGVVAYIVAAPWIYGFFFPNYPEAVFLTQLAAATLITQPAALLTQYLEAQAMLKELRYTQWISAGVFLLSLVTLIPLYGLPGAVLSRGILRLSYAACSLWCLLREPGAQK